MQNKFTLRPVRATDAPALFPMIYQSTVTDAILWDGPTDLAAYEAALSAKEEATCLGPEHMFTIFVGDAPAGSCSFRPEADNDYRADLGLWIGAPFHGRGAGTFAVKELLKHGFQMPGIVKIEANVFVGNTASRRIFEKNHFQLEGTIRANARKRGVILDEWLFGITREDYETHH